MAIFKVTAVPDFSQLKGEIAKLQSTPVTLGVDTRQANVNLKATTQNLTRMMQVFDGSNKLTGAVAQFSGKVGETVQITQQLNAESGKLEVTQSKVTQNFEAQSRAAQKAAAQVQAANDAYRAYAAQQNRTYSPTAMQSRIESLTGVSGLSGKSARESAAAFEKAWLNAGYKVQGSAEKAAQKVKSVGTAAKETSGFADLMGDSFGRVVAKMALWQIMGNAIAGVRRSFSEALDTMKAVDDEMVTIRKVTGATTAELNKIEKQAYDTASAYGVAADEYLNSVANFSRAGYGEQASALAELATKTQIVGDTDAETAQQFLLSVDAAYKYQGNIEKLTAVLDGANEIDNKYATSIQKIAEGLGKVAPIAAQAHVGVDELTAAIGTITAVTQRSGTEAATALRALFLNIIGDTKTEIDEGVTWTTGEIAGLRDVIKLYAKDAYDAAQASGDVINPMKAIAGLSQSMKDGVLTEQKLMEMVSDIGGKLRTSQLLALIQNWDMYQSMLGDFADAAGSADKEVENALDSWTRKTEILSNKWAQFISHLVETDTIKGALDGVIGLVELLDTDVGRFVITVAALTTGVTALGKGLTWLKGTELIKNGKALVGIFVDAASGAGSFKDVLTLLNPKLLIVIAAVAALYGAYKLVSHYVEEANRSLASFDAEIEDANKQLESNKQRIEEINGLPWEQRTSEILEEKKALEEENAELEKQIALLDKQKTERAREIAKESVGTGEIVTVSHKGTTSGSMSTTFEKTVAGAEAYKFLTEQLNEYNSALERNGEIADSVKEQYEKDIAASARMVEALKQMRDAGDDLTEEQKELIAAYDNFVYASDSARNAIKNLVSRLIEEARQSGATGKALYDLVAAQITASSTELNFSQQIAALRQLAAEAGYAAEAYGNLLNAGRIYQQAMVLVANGKFKTLEEAQAYLTDKAWSSLTSTAPSGGWNSSAGTGSGGSGGGSGSGSDAAERKRAQAAIKALEKERDAELEPLDDQIDALKKQNEEIERGEKLEELKLDILKKQDALLNARNERTVRMYNAATGQWEWVADAQKVKDAEEALEDAKKDLRDYERQTELDLAIEELEARKEAIKAAYQIKIDAWQDYLDGLSGAVDAEGAYIAQSVQQNEDAAQEIAGAWEEAEKRRRNALVRAAVASLPENNFGSWQDTKAGSIISDVMDDNSKKSDKSSGKKPTGGGGGVNKVARYDSGGVLKGLGGIKATADDEMVLPPDITARMLRPSANAAFQARMRELRGLYDPAPAMGRSLAGKTDNRSYTDHSGPEYHYGNITLTQAQAETTTVAEFMRMAHHLQPYKG